MKLKTKKIWNFKARGLSLLLLFLLFTIQPTEISCGLFDIIRERVIGSNKYTTTTRRPPPSKPRPSPPSPKPRPPPPSPKPTRSPPPPPKTPPPAHLSTSSPPPTPFPSPSPSIKNPNGCSRLSVVPNECRTSNCHFSCMDRTCYELSGTKECTIRSSLKSQREFCPEHCHDVCGCRSKFKCEYDVVGGNCRSNEYYSSCRDDLFIQGECRRNKKYYIEGGIACYNKKSAGSCQHVEQIRAVNLNGEEYLDQVRDIKYRADKSVPYLDPYFTRSPGDIMDSESEMVKGITEEEKALYAKFIFGANETSAPGRCLSYVIPLTLVGSYELCFKFASIAKEPYKRLFTVKFNDEDILLEVDLFKPMKIGNMGIAIDFVINFDVSEDNLLWLKGYRPTDIKDGKVKLSFCYSKCAVEQTGYMISAFHIVRFNGASESVLTHGGDDYLWSVSEENDNNEDDGSDNKGSGETVINPVDPEVIDVADEDAKCLESSGNSCDCRKSGCEYNVFTKACRWRETVCHQINFTSAECRKSNSFISYGGILCNVQESRGNCNMTKAIYAVNIYGEDHVDSSGLQFKKDEPQHFTDSLGIRQVQTGVKCGKDNQKIRSIPEGDEDLYSSIIIADSDSSSGCISYRASIPEDGRYLLNIKAVDHLKSRGNQRFFNVEFNGLTVLPEVDLVSLRGPCTANDFLINFHVVDDRETILMSGQRASRVLDGETIISFCYSGCDVSRKEFTVSGISILQLENTGEGIPEKSGKEDVLVDDDDNDNDDDNSEEDELPENFENCGSSESRGSPCLCRKNGCEYSSATGYCMPKSINCEGGPKLTGCMRGSNAYYSEGGVLCKATSNFGETDSCNIKNFKLAVNVNGDYYLSSDRAVPYEADQRYLFQDEYKTRQRIHVKNWEKSRCKQGLLGIQPSEEILYTSLVFGKSQKTSTGRCISYTTDIGSSEGFYELSIKTVETILTIRHFSIRINNKTILEEFNIRRYAKMCEGMEIIIEFELKDGMINVFGFTNPIPLLTDGGIKVGFCNGKCKSGKYYDPSYLVAAFYIAELNGPKNPPLPTKKPTTTTTSTTTTKSPDTTRVTSTAKPTSITTISTTVKPSTTGFTTISTTRKPTTRTSSTVSPPTILKPPPVPPTEFITDDPCQQYTGDNCECRHESCEINTATGKCLTDLNTNCEETVLFEREDCRRSNAFYSFGGTTCRTQNSGGNCQILKNVFSLNFNGFRYTDSRGITYQAMSAVSPYESTYSFVFKEGLYSGPGVTSKCNSLTDPILAQPKDRALYMDYILGSDSPSGSCFSYLIPLKEDGFYELTVKTVELEKRNVDERRFNIIFNRITLFAEVDLIRLNPWKQKCVAMDLIQIFDVLDGGKTLNLRGHSTVSIPSEGVLLEFCNSGCTLPGEFLDANFIGSAFSVLKLGKRDGSEPEPDGCINVDNVNHCVCRHLRAGCQYHQVDGCINGNNLICNLTESRSLCTRANTMYAVGGGICRNVALRGDCGTRISKVIKAINFGSKQRYTDARGISYQPEDKSYTDPDMISVDGVISEEISGTNPELNDDQLYETYVTQKEGNEGKGCLSFKIRIPDTEINYGGPFELSVKMIEFLHDSPGKRFFSVYFAERLIIPEIDIVELAGGKYHALEIVFNFIRRRGRFYFDHFTKYITFDKSIEVKICGGECYDDPEKDNRFVVSALSLVLLPPSACLP